MPAGALIDAHVHVYSCFEPAAFLDAAVTNFSATGKLGAARVLCLSESAGDAWFEALARNVADLPSAWTCHDTAEDVSRSLTHRNGSTLFVVAGHQVVTDEDLEVLTLGMRRKLPDGASAEATVQQALDAGALPVLPWGFGKWLGARGTLVAALKKRFGDDLLLGDNGGRLAGTRPAPMLRRVSAAGECVLSGSDPLPVAGGERRVASFGVFLPGEVDYAAPWQSISRLLEAGAAEPYGRLESPVAFVCNQLMMQWRKRQRVARASRVAAGG